MKRLLLFISIIIFLLSPLRKAEAQRNQIVNNGDATSAVNFPGAGCVYNWTNDSPGIGLAASGTGDISSFIAVNAGSSPVTATITATPASFLYLASNNALSVINTGTNAITNIALGLGSSPLGVALSPDGSKAYVTDNAPGTLTVVSTATGSILSVIPVGDSPDCVTVSPDGSRVYVANGNSNSVTVINAVNNTLITTVTVGAYPYGIAETPDGTKVYVTNYMGSSVSVINALDNIVSSTITVGADPFAISLSPDGSRAYVANQLSNSISVINTAANTVISTIAVGKNPYNVTASPDGKLVYVSNYLDNTVSVIDALTNSVISTFATGKFPYDISISPDSKLLYIVNNGDNNISVIDAATKAVKSTIPFNGGSNSLGNLIGRSANCSNAAITATITVNPAPATPAGITASTATGSISGCAGSESASPFIQQFTVSGSSLTGGITATAPANFEVSLSPGSSYASSVTITPSGGAVGNTIVYVRSAATAPAGGISDKVVLSSAGATSKNVAVSGRVNDLPGVNAVANQIKNSGDLTDPVHFTGTANTFTWTNDTPAIGLAASGTGDVASFTAVNTDTAPVVAKITVTPVNAGLLYIANEGSKNISVVNGLTHAVTATLNGGDDPYGVSVSPDGKRAYVSNFAPGTISVVDVAANKILKTITVGNNPWGSSISADGSRLYVANGGSNSVSVINTSTNSVIATILVDQDPVTMLISPDGRWLYVANDGSASVSVINTATNIVVRTIPAGINPMTLAANPDGSVIYTANPISNSVSVISTVTNTVIATIRVGLDPWGIAISRDGKWVYVSNYGSSNVSVISTATNQVTTTIPVGLSPLGISVDPVSGQISVVNSNSNTVSVIDPATNSVVATVPVGATPLGLSSLVTGGAQCPGQSITFTITVNPPPLPVITTGPLSGNISACEGMASASPNIEQFTVSGSALTADITALAPPGFEISLSANSGYGGSLTITPSGGTVSSTAVYVRSAAAPTGGLSGSISLTSAGAGSQNVVVTGAVSALPTVNDVLPLSVNSGDMTAAINFTGTANTFAWVNDTPGIGLALSGKGDIASFTARNPGTTAITAHITVTPESLGYAYIANSTSNNVFVINTATNLVESIITVGQTPTGSSLSPDGKRLYVANQGSNSVSVISTVTNTLLSTIPIPDFGPTTVTVSPDGKRLYVVNLNSNNVVVINTVTNAIIATVGVGGYPVCAAVKPDGSLVYVVNSSNSISVIDAASNLVKTVIPVGQSPYGISISPDGSKAYVVISGADNVIVINTATNTVTATIPVGSNPAGIVLSPDGSLAYVTNQFSKTVSVINTSTNKVIATIPVGASPAGISIGPDGSRIFVANYDSNNATVISTATNTVLSTIPVGSNPRSLGSFVTGGIGCNGIPVTFTITVNPELQPAISASGELSPLTTVYGTPSASTILTVSGTNMSAGILVTPPAGFEVSIDGVTFTSTVTVGSAGTIPATSVYIRLASSTSVGNYSDNIKLTSTGAPTVNKLIPLSTVTPASLAIVTDDKTKTYGDPNPVFTATYIGFVNGDGPAQLTALPVFATTAATTSPLGQYPITVSGAASPNYTITSLPGVLTIIRPPGPVTIPNAFTPNGDGINDTWNVKNLDTYPSCTVMVYNRYGETVYSSIGYGVPWNGTYKGAALPTGTYYYIINLNNDTKALAGFVAIIR